VNALELLPPADSFYKRDWGYDTSHYLAPDAELGFPEEFSSSTANQDLAALVKACHANGIRFLHRRGDGVRNARAVPDHQLR
jgi:pullulanase